MTSRARLFVSLSLALSTIAVGARGVAADPLLTAIHLAPQDAGPAGGAPAQPQTPPANATPPMLADVTGPATPVGLPELLQLAVRQAPSLATAQIDIEVAEASVLAATAWADWALGAQLAGSTRTAGGGQFSSSNTVSLSGDVVKQISTGGTIGLHAEAGWNRSEFVGDLGSLNQLTELASITFNQPLLRGRGRANVEGAERIARASRDAAVVARRAAAIQMVQTVVLAYLDLVDAERQLEIRRASLELAKERLRVTAAGIDKGGVAKAETIPVEQAIATREEEVLAGELAILSQSLTLRRQVAMPVAQGDMVLSSKLDLAIPQHAWNQNEIVAAAEASSPEMARLAALEKGATIQIEVTENGLLPQLDLALNAGPSITTTLTDVPGEEDRTDFGVAAGASLTYSQSIGKTAANAAVRKVRAQRHQLQVTATDVHNQIVEATARAVATIQVAERRYAIAVRAVALGEQNLTVEQARLGLGKSRNVDVLQRQDELRAAQLRASVAITDWHRAAASIAALTGEILPEYGITLDETSR